MKPRYVFEISAPHSLKIEKLTPGILAFIFAAGCLKKNVNSDVNQFSQNTALRDATPAESEYVLNLGNCSAFLLETNGDSMVAVSARQCLNYRATEWCANQAGITTHNGQSGQCTGLVAGDADSDIVAFKVALPSRPPREQTLRAAGFRATANLSLKMISYCSDQGQAQRLRVADGCSLVYENVDSPVQGLNDSAALHNCSTDHNMASGMILLHGTRIVVGIPFTNSPEDPLRKTATGPMTAAAMARMDGFVSRYNEQLAAAGVVIASTPEDSEAQETSDSTERASSGSGSRNWDELPREERCKAFNNDGLTCEALGVGPGNDKCRWNARWTCFEGCAKWITTC